MYLEHVAKYYAVVLTPDQMSVIGLLSLIAIAGIVIFNLGKKLKPPMNDDENVLLPAKWCRDEPCFLNR